MGVTMLVRNRLTEKDVRLELEAFEGRYGVPTALLERAFTSEGRLTETPDFARWSLLRRAHERLATANNAPRSA